MPCFRAICNCVPCRLLVCSYFRQKSQCSGAEVLHDAWVLFARWTVPVHQLKLNVDILIVGSDCWLELGVRKMGTAVSKQALKIRIRVLVYKITPFCIFVPKARGIAM